MYLWWLLLTCRFDSIIWFGSGNHVSILVHTPTVVGLPVTLDWTGRVQANGKIRTPLNSNAIFFSWELPLMTAYLLLTWTLHLAHTEVHTAVGQVFHHSVQSNWLSIAHTCSQGVLLESLQLRGSQKTQNNPSVLPFIKLKINYKSDDILLQFIIIYSITLSGCSLLCWVYTTVLVGG